MSSGAEFEEYVRGIYSILLNLKDDGIVVSGGANTFLKGISGETYQIDVYYEFERAGIQHKVIIECKDWKNPVKREVINALESKVRDIPGVIGVIISRNGYQSGAINFSQQKGILALTSKDLPCLGSLIGERLKTVALPDESCIGEPFWTIMMTRSGKNTGVWFGLGLNREDNRSYIPLFFSKYFADLFLEEMKIDKGIWGVRGLPQYSRFAHLF
ncbi:restriction endonuclease [cf. Phormidesmis sp. LEGE 11477]|uniref:restriction endonuclease n=1 Tax=cf. Phormidesmis sp. LEGE 11477 TaxID=1828680 RepID=UPI00187E523B|nr:restriction endonuclease [cf. Phormidesmis sp. LEGE 11477]MBE9063366.1 restriction endonuclease [cf. Phormidesmis sp. LEGE 11477]